MVAKRLRILFVGSFVGSRIREVRRPGDEKFWLDLIAWLAARGHHLQILSLTYDTPASAPPEYEFLRPIPVLLPSREARYNRGARWMGATNNYASKSLSFPRILQALDRNIREFRPDVIHFTENYGPIMALLPLLGGRVSLTISTPTYARDAPFYDKFLQMSLRSFDGVAPFSEAFAEILREIGVTTPTMAAIRWGVDLNRFHPPSDRERKEARELTGIPDDRILLVWTGFIQQTGWADFRFSYRLAELVLQQAPDKFEFVFCFKPQSFQRRFLDWKQPGIRIFGASEDFWNLRIAADYLVSPMQAPHCTAAPPLTWVESLAMGLPLIVTPLPGVREVVMSGTNGWVVHSPEEARDRLLGSGSDRLLIRRLRSEARRVAVDRLGLDRAGQQFVDFWERVLDPHLERTDA